MSSHQTLSMFLILFICGTCVAGDAPANSMVAVDDAFDRAELGDEWHVNTGNWRIENGVLKASEVADDMHSAAARRIIETKNAVYEFRFRLTGDAKSLHFGFDPAKGELEKKGHLFSVIVTPEFWKIMKHVDKNQPKADPNEVLASAQNNFSRDTWYTLRVITWGQYVTARIDDTQELKAEHETFHVKKPTLVFRCVGDGIEIDDLKVWKPVK